MTPWNPDEEEEADPRNFKGVVPHVGKWDTGQRIAGQQQRELKKPTMDNQSSFCVNPIKNGTTQLPSLVLMSLSFWQKDQTGVVTHVPLIV